MSADRERAAGLSAWAYAIRQKKKRDRLSGGEICLEEGEEPVQSDDRKRKFSSIDADAGDDDD